MKITIPKYVQKSWGHELIIHNSHEYCGKLLVFPIAGDKFSMHYHLDKKESWFVAEGSFRLYYFDTSCSVLHWIDLEKGECVDVEPGQPHQLEALEDGSTIFEVSTRHVDSDSYRISGAER